MSALAYNFVRLREDGHFNIDKDTGRTKLIFYKGTQILTHQVT